MPPALQLLRVVAVVALLCLSAALAAPPGRLPLALRGIRRMMRRDADLAGPGAADAAASPMRRALAFLCALSAVALALV